MSAKKRKDIEITEEIDEGREDAPAVEEAEAGEAAEARGEATDEVSILRQEVEEWRDKFLRAKAEQQNAMRRAANERQEAILYANADLLRLLLDVMDDFDRTLEMSQTAESVEAVLEGVRLIRDKFEKLLRDSAVEPIDAQDAEFDPNLHQALMRQPTTEHAPGTVVQQVQRGYKHRDRVLRPAKVIVATEPPAEAESGSESEG